MQCPLCHQNLYEFGGSIKAYNCSTTVKMLALDEFQIEGTSFWNTNSHYEIRGHRTTIYLPDNYRIITWKMPSDSNGYSTILRFVKNKGYQKVFECQAFPIESEEKLINRIKTLVLFS